MHIFKALESSRIKSWHSYDPLGLVVLFVTLIATVIFADVPTITNVVAQQRYPWNGKVDITYTITGDIASEVKQKALIPALKIIAIDGMTGMTNTATQLSGDVGLEAGSHSVVWDMDAEGLSLKSTNVIFNVICEVTPALYCVIDLSAGAGATVYPVNYLASPPSNGFNVDEYKTEKLVLRRIEAGSLKLRDKNTVRLTKPFFCGLFEVTQKQYALVMDTNPSYYKGDERPVSKVSYDMIRGSVDGAKWPSSSAVDSSSFMGKLRVRTGLDFDLPTEAQWEYACRAGTTSKYNNGGDSIDDLKQLGRYCDNKSDGRGGYSQSTKVGSYQPNNWGLYDMHGNENEWCLDWYTSNLLNDMTDPVGSSSGTYTRVIRGGFWDIGAGFCTSSFCSDSGHDVEGHGFRIVRTLASTESSCLDILCYGESENNRIDLANDTRMAAFSERIFYSIGWANETASGANVIVAVNDEPIATAIDSGHVDWTPMSNGIYVLTHKVMSGGEQIGDMLTAMFVVDGLKVDVPEFSPASGSIFNTSLSVSILCATEGATIHYTTDGSEPTFESPSYRRFRITEKTTIKAIAEKDGWYSSEVVTAEYALGQCVDPVISLVDGSTFSYSNQVVSIEWNNDGTLRYTLDGSEPTAESPIYEEPFVISESTVVKAKVFSDDFFDSAVVTANLTRVWENVVAPHIEAVASFTGSKTKVVISCATKGALVHYTVDGSDPDSSSLIYSAPFCVTNSCMIKAYAEKPDYLDSGIVMWEISKVRDIGDTMGKPDHGFTTDGSGGVGWARVEDATAPNGEAMKSGEIMHSQQSVLETKVTGAGTLTFAWRTSCEDSGGQYDWDHAEFAVDGTVLLQRDGINSWTNEIVRIEGAGEHTVTWTYKKDGVESDGDDATYVAGYGWVSDYTETQTTEVPVPYAWLTAHDPGVVDEYDAYEASAKATAANGRKVWECYVVGLDPEDADEDFRITKFPMKADGTPDLANLEFEPTQDKWNVPGASPVIKGAAALGGEWQTVTDENKAGFRFFKVVVELP